MNSEMVIKLAGQAGQGIQTITAVLMKALSRQGLRIFAVQDYMSRVRGGNNFNQIRFGPKPVYSMKRKSHIVVALDRESLKQHEKELADPGYIIFDPDIVNMGLAEKKFLPIPLSGIARENGDPIYSNSVATGSVAALLGLDFNEIEKVFTERFSHKKPGALEGNVKSSKVGYDFILEGHKEKIFSSGTYRTGNGYLLLNGGEAIGLGAIQGGCRFISAYPMSPSTGIFSFITQRAKRFGIVSEQAEDEIASINMALGASSAGARAMTTTSGGGLALMAEGISMAGVAEIPIVIVNAQRPGPATGLPTRTGQEDLEFTLYIGHGEFPRFVFAPGTVEEAFYTTIHAFNLADKYQVPVFILADQHLVDSFQTIKRLNPNRVKKRSYLATDKDIKKNYLRYANTANGISPRAYFMQGEFTFMVDSHEHTEDGHITEEIHVRNNMVEKRFRKEAGMRKEFGGPSYYGERDAKTVFVCWGSNYGAVRETVDSLNKEKRKTAMIHFNRLWPFPEKKAMGFLKSVRRVINVESNYRGQFGRLLKIETGITPHFEILRYDGRPMTAEYLLQQYPGKKNGR